MPASNRAGAVRVVLCAVLTVRFALRPAPVIVNWLGYPGSMGTPHHHYIIADNEIIPPEYEKYYSETVLRTAAPRLRAASTADLNLSATFPLVASAHERPSSRLMR